jgi:hypothetical protein
MRIEELDAESARQALAAHRDERNDRLDRLTRFLEADERIAAAWLLGSLGRGAGDDLSDLDLFVVVHDAFFDTMAGSPAARKAFVEEAGGRPLVLNEAPQNAPPGGSFAGVLYAGALGPGRVDWCWQPRSAAVVPIEGVRVLFDRTRLTVADTSIVLEYQPIPDTSPEEYAARDCGAFWTILLIAAKYVARTPDEEGMGLLHWAYSALNALERFAGVEQTPEEGVAAVSDSATAGSTALVDPVTKIAVLRRLAARMVVLTPIVSARGVEVPDMAIHAQAERYLDMVEAASRRRR